MATDVDSLAGIIVTGMPGYPLKDIALSNIRVEYRGGGTADLADKPYREQGTHYPEPRWAGPTPAFGLYARHVDGLRVDRLNITLQRPDQRPAIILDDVVNDAFTAIQYPK